MEILDPGARQEQEGEGGLEREKTFKCPSLLVSKKLCGMMERTVCLENEMPLKMRVATALS